MRNGGIGASARNGREGYVLQHAGVTAEPFQRNGCINLGEFFGDRFTVKPCEKAGHGRTIAGMGCAGARNFSLIFHGLHQGDHVDTDIGLPACIFEQGNEAARGGGGIKFNLGSCLAKAV